jgi:Mn2+/Fe2+ NRAMP family transporter
MDRSARRGAWRQLALALGPGLVVMLADTEAGSVISAAQAGAQFQYRLVLLQFLLLPPLVMAQELAARLGLATRQGLAELVLRRYGRAAAGLLLAALVASCAGALVTELSGLAGAGELYGIPVWQTTAVTVVALLAVVGTGSYRAVERIAIAVGLSELAFVGLAWLARPVPAEMAAQLFQMPLGDPAFRTLVAANLGTCIIPWAVVYQQSASIDKGLSHRELRGARLETLGGAVLCQVVTAAVVIAAAAALGHGAAAGRPLDRVGDIATAFAAGIGEAAGRAVFVAGVSGGALVAANVVCLTVAWSFGEVFGLRHALSVSPWRRPWFYGAFAAVLLPAGGLVVSGASLVGLAIGAGVLNALVLPVVLFFLYRLARCAPPEALRLGGAYAVLVALVLLLTAMFGIYAGVSGAL